jgi:hypothetical protein
MSITDLNSTQISSKKDENIDEALQQVLGIVEQHQQDRFITDTQFFNHFLSSHSNSVEGSIGSLNGNSEIKRYLEPTQVSKDYFGVHLSTRYQDTEFHQLAESFNNYRQLDPFYVLRIIRDAEKIIQVMPNIRQCYCESE